MSLKGARLRAHLEDLGYLVFSGGPLMFVVAKTNAKTVANYSVSDDDASFLWGWVEHRKGTGRTDCLSWIEFDAEIQEHTP